MAAAERRLVRPEKCRRHIDLTVQAPQSSTPVVRPAFAVSLVVDRSGSMQGEKLETAKAAALTVLDGLGERDSAAVAVFDDKVEVILPEGPMTAERKAQARAALGGVKARAQTALHEGWLMGCRSIAPENSQSTTHGRDGEDMKRSFSGELAEMFDVTARAVRVEIEAAPSVTPELISLFWGAKGDRPGALRIDMGDLISGDVRHVVVRLAFGRVPVGALVKVKARVAWRDGDQDREGPWQELTFEGAADAACSAEARDMAIMHWVGLRHAEKAKGEALTMHRNGQDEDALRLLDRVMRRLAEYASSDSELVKALEELRDLRESLHQGSMTQGMAKEMRFSSQLSSRGQRDNRGGKPGTA